MPPWLLKSAPTTRSKLKYGIGVPCQVPTTRKSNLSLAGSSVTTLLLTFDCGRLLRFGTATTPSRAHRRVTRASFVRGSTLLVRVEDVVLRLHGHMARVSAVRGAGIGREIVGCGFVVEQGVSPSAALRKSLAVLFDDEGLREDIRHIHDERRLRALLRLPLKLHDLGAIRERLPVVRNAGLVGLDHGRIGHDQLEHLVGPGGRDHRPILVPPEIRERDSAWRIQRVLVLRINGRAAHDGKPCRGCRNREFALALHGRSLLMPVSPWPLRSSILAIWPCGGYALCEDLPSRFVLTSPAETNDPRPRCRHVHRASLDARSFGTPKVADILWNHIPSARGSEETGWKQ